MTLLEFWNKCNMADWTYMMSDDGRVFNKGAEAMNKLREASKQSEAHFKMFINFYAHVWKGEPKPERPNE